MTRYLRLPPRFSWLSKYEWFAALCSNAKPLYNPSGCSCCRAGSSIQSWSIYPIHEKPAWSQLTFTKFVGSISWALPNLLKRNAFVWTCCPYCAIPLILLLTKNICIITLYPILCGRWNGTSSISFGIYIIGLQHSPYGHINWKNT